MNNNNNYNNHNDHENGDEDIEDAYVHWPRLLPIRCYLFL